MADSTKTSQANEADSMLDLAEKLRDGKGCTQDVNRAFVLAYEAVAKGRRARALRTLAYFYRGGFFAAKDHKKANNLYCRSANTGSKFAYYQLGRSYLEGWGVKKDLAAAKFLFEKAIEKGAQKANDEIKKIPDSVRSDKSGISGYTGEPDKGSLPDFVTADYEKAKEGKLWNPNFCKTCHGKGRIQCDVCGGTHKRKCDKCKGHGRLKDCRECRGHAGWVACPICDCSGKHPCEVCHGRKEITRVNQWGEKYKDICPNCNGRGHMGETCLFCDGKGIVPCRRCNGTGKAECEKCHGTGEVECNKCNTSGEMECPECRRRDENAKKKKEQAEQRAKKRRESLQGCGCLVVIIALIGLVIWGPEWLSGNVVGDILGKVRDWSCLALLWIWALIVTVAKFAWHHWIISGIVIAVLIWKSKR